MGLLSILNSCHPCIEIDSAVPITNNPRITGEKADNEPSESEPLWKVIIYETLKDAAEEEASKDYPSFYNPPKNTR